MIARLSAWIESMPDGQFVALTWVATVVVGVTSSLALTIAVEVLSR
jgi:hypothetical protein